MPKVSYAVRKVLSDGYIRRLYDAKPPTREQIARELGRNLSKIMPRSDLSRATREKIYDEIAKLSDTIAGRSTPTKAEKKNLQKREAAAMKSYVAQTMKGTQTKIPAVRETQKKLIESITGPGTRPGGKMLAKSEPVFYLQDHLKAAAAGTVEVKKIRIDLPSLGISETLEMRTPADFSAARRRVSFLAKKYQQLDEGLSSMFVFDIEESTFDIFDIYIHE